jgi:hypothetical protein
MNPALIFLLGSLTGGIVMSLLAIRHYEQLQNLFASNLKASTDKARADCYAKAVADIKGKGAS